MTKNDTARFDLVLARLVPPVEVILAIGFTFALTMVLFFFPGLTERAQLDSLAFGVTICWMPAGIAWMVIAAIRAGDNARRVGYWLGASVFIGLAALLFISMLMADEADTSTRVIFLLLCGPLALPPLIPAAIYLVRLWREVA